MALKKRKLQLKIVEDSKLMLIKKKKNCEELVNILAQVRVSRAILGCPSIGVIGWGRGVIRGTTQNDHRPDRHDSEAGNLAPTQILSDVF
ncbi:MAG: hypothetical protein GY820_26795 [Gammaproteobacteria bacterium]|nr:hypothetical protein [Gammaproteobacteria bacterium]